MLVDLVQVQTRDGVRLDGTYRAPPRPGAGGVAIDAFCLVHGTGGNFYSSTLFDAVADRLAGLGCGVLRVNTRGHDGISTAVTAGGGRRLGAAYETVGDCRHDVAAWLTWLRERAGPRVGLVGHSMGAVKAVYALAQEPDVPAACLVALSPPCLSYARFAEGPQGAEFLKTFATAERQVEEGRPAALMEVSLPLPMVITAAGYIEKYGPDERYHVIRLLAGVGCPVLATFGGQEVETNPAFRGLPGQLQALAGRRSRLDVQVIEKADHFYTGARDELADRVASWLRSALPSAG